MDDRDQQTLSATTSMEIAAARSAAALERANPDAGLSMQSQWSSWSRS